MSLKLCKAFRRTPSDFFSPKYDKIALGTGPQIPLITAAHARRCASSGCPFCTILVARADLSWCPTEILEQQPLVLRRATIDPNQAFVACIGVDDISHIFFFRVPPIWRNESISRLNEPSDQLTLMRAWISHCMSQHPKCKEAAGHVLPTRLLDVKAFADSDDIKLINSHATGTAKYVTLSHCWGPPSKHPIATTKATLKDRMVRIRFEDLSLTFKDAVRICRDLRQPYLWIDSLCIVQDDSDDWARQAASMASVYGGSQVTLAALSSSDSSQGCRVRLREPNSAKLSRYHDFDFGSRRVRIFEDHPRMWHKEYGDNPYKHEGYGDNPLRTRAWTLQERELSMRSIHFSQDQLLWECRTMRGSTELPWHEMKPEFDDYKPSPLKLQLGENFSSDGPAFQRDRWYEITEDYSSRYMTEEMDKLPALAGLAAKFHEEQDPGNYYAGIWSDHLPSALLWRTVPLYSRPGSLFKPVNPLAAFQPRRPQAYRAPSWSWASIDGEISYESQRTTDIDDSFQVDYGEFEITGVYYQLASNFDPLGAPSDAALRVQGLIARVYVDFQPIEQDPSSGLRLMVGNDGRRVGVFYPDIISEFQLVESIFCLSVRAELYASYVSMPSYLYGVFPEQAQWADFGLVMGLALLRSRSSGIYRRVGLVRWLKKSVFNGTPQVELRIV